MPDAEPKVNLCPPIATREGGQLKAVEFVQDMLTLTLLEANPRLLPRLRKHLDNHYAAAEARTTDTARLAFQDRVQSLQLAIALLESEFERGLVGPPTRPPLA